MNYSLCKLKPKGPLHLGEREGWLEGSSTFIHSDTLFSAYCHSYLLLYGVDKLESLLRKFKEAQQPPFLISSAFPYWGARYYFPVPKNQLPKEKAAKRLIFIEKAGFEILLKGERIESVLDSFPVIPSKEEPRYPWIAEDVPRVALSRLTAHPGENFFHFGIVTYREDAGLFFLVQFQDSETEHEFKAAMNLLADEGLGGDRSCGKGLMYQPEFDELELDEMPASAACDGTVCLSLYYPVGKEIELLAARGFYEIIDRKGYIYSPQGQSLRRRSVRMLSEGSVIPSSADGSNIRGGLVDVTPEEVFKPHRVYRYGLLFGIPCQLEVKE